MSWAIILILIAIVTFYFSGNRKTTDQSHRKSFLPPIPSGYQIFANNIPVAGIRHRKGEALQFAKSANQELALERDPSNQFDKNAIKLLGLSDKNQYFIGYLPKELSAQIIGSEMFDGVRARLERIYIGNNDFLDIQYQIIGPKVSKKKFDDFLRNQPADSSQKNYFNFFGMPTPKGLTAGQAAQAISDHRKTSTFEEQEEWECYTNILREFDDKDFRECYDLGRVSKSVLREVIDQLKVQGKTCKYLSDNIDEVVEKIIKLKS